MTQLVFIHGPGAGGCAEAWVNQLAYFPRSVAPTLPGVLAGAPCPDVTRYMEWVRGWLWAQGMCKDLVLVGYTLGSSIALQYALDYPGEVLGLVLTTVAAGPATPRPGRMELRLKAAAGDADAYKEWFEFQRRAMMWVEPQLRDRLMEQHRRIGPMSQYQLLDALHNFDARERLHTLQPRLLLIRGANDPGNHPETEQEIQYKIPGAGLVRVANAGHFPATERPDEVNRLIEKFIATLC